MEKLMLGKTGLMVSAIAMGGIPIMRLGKAEAVKVIRAVVDMGINFIDTANSYVDSEEKIGEALKPYRREDVIIASKSAARDKAAFLKHVQLSLKRLNTSYIDIHYLHGVNTVEDMEKVMGEQGAYQGLAEAVRDGKIRHMAFSSHSLDTALKMVRTDKFEVLQFPFNFVEKKAAEKLIPEALKRNMGFIAMKPLGEECCPGQNWRSDSCPSMRI
ncbi:MAG: aldo/keto reductase [Actinomycetota bacterium]|nr:aldo/keto reductase [Actinomycetota bacterium]